jgi:TIR domain
MFPQKAYILKNFLAPQNGHAVAEDKSFTAMPKNHTYAAFVSHASQDALVAGQIDKALQTEQLSTWVDATHLAFGNLLREEPQSAIQNSRVLVLLWSEAASQSRWVMAEMFTALHLDRFIIPYALDATPLPQFLANSAYVSQKGDRQDTTVIESLVNGIGAAQLSVVQTMSENFTKAGMANKSVEKTLESVTKIAPLDLMVLNLNG